MPRIIAIDYGLKRCGLAVSDPLQMIATPLDTVPPSELLPYLRRYLEREEVEAFVLGLPKGLDGKATDATLPVLQFSEKLRHAFPKQKVHYADERFTSVMAAKSMVEGGASKKYRRDKGNVDKISAVIILRDFLQ